MQTNPAAINNSATPEALRHLIPDHLLNTSQRSHYENLRILVQVMARSVDLSIETAPGNQHAPAAPMLRISTGEFGQHLKATDTRALALVLLQLADVQEELAQQGGAA